MKTIKQMLRQPLRTMAGILIVALAVAILVASVGQYVAITLTRANLDDHYDTVAALSDQYFWSDIPGGREHATKLPDEIQEWISTTLMGRTDLVNMESFPQLYSAYAPGLRHDNFSHYADGDNYEIFGMGVGNPYRCAMLEVTLSQVGTVVKEDKITGQMANGLPQEFVESVTLLCVGTVERVIALEDGFASPVGKTIVLTIQVDSMDTLDAMELKAGERYLIYGLDYTDIPGGRSQNATTSLKQYEELFGPAGRVGNTVDWIPILEQIECSMTVCNFASLPDVIFGNGGLELRPDLRMYTYRDGNEWPVKFISAEEFMGKYSVPTIVSLSGTAEDFLQTEGASLWRKTLEEMEYNLHGFPVLAVDKLGYQLAFARGEARIVEGRDFTEAERTGAGRVCILSEAVALASGLSVGDTIVLQTYALDANVGSGQDNSTFVSNFPAAALYSRAMGFTSEKVTYTIVGLYRQNNAWQDEGQTGGNAHGFSPDTIFVPKGSISGEPLMGTSGIMYSLVLHNGKMAEFQILQEKAGYPDLFICYDQGYANIVTGLDAYEGVSWQALQTGLWAYGAVMLLFILLFPLRQRAVLATMDSLGANRWRKLCHLMVGSVGLLIPGTLLGTIVGVLAWEKVAEELMASLSVMIPLEADLSATVPRLSLAQLLAVAFVVFVLSIFATGSKNMRNRKKGGK